MTTFTHALKRKAQLIPTRWKKSTSFFGEYCPANEGRWMSKRRHLGGSGGAHLLSLLCYAGAELNRDSTTGLCDLENPRRQTEGC